MKRKVDVRVAIEADYDKIEELLGQVQDLHIKMRPDIYKTVDVVMHMEEFLEKLQKNTIYVATYGEDVVGLVSYLIRHIESWHQVTRNVLFIDTIVVDEKYRNKGIGRELVRFVIAKKDELQLDGIELQVNAKNLSAKKIYEELGFTTKSINYELLQ